MSKFAISHDAFIVGAGPAGIAMAYQLKYKLGFHDFTIYEKLDGVGGTWRTNSYPGWYVDVHIVTNLMVVAEPRTVDAIYRHTYTLLVST